jgi:hypothetical protein
MRWTDIPWRPPASRLRWFAAIWLVWFAGLAAAAWLGRGDDATAIVLLALALTVGPLGLVRPVVLRPVYVGWLVLVYPIGWLVSQVLLALLFYCLFTPIALLFRLIGRDPLGRHLDRTRESYWVPKPAAKDARSYFRQS